MTARPSGTITFLFTDIEGSSKLWERHPEAMRHALAKHDRILRASSEANGGFVFKTIGDAFCMAFHTAHQAVACAVQVQRELHGESWDGIGAMKVRVALHTGPAELRDDDYFGPSLNRVSRMLAAAHGGQTLVSRVTEELVRDYLPPDVRLRELGEFRLRDLARPEHIFQVICNDLPSEFPALRSLESVPNNLPVQLTNFIGREREIVEVKHLIAGNRLVTLIGTGGTGKTRLSLQVAAEVLDKYVDGVWFVEFATIGEAALVYEAVASALNVRQEPERPLSATLTDFLRQKHLLLIFDNCEHLIGSCASLAETLLRSSPRLVILASSREPLGIPGETSCPLAPLSMSDHWREIASRPNAVEELKKFEAIRLFIDRVTLARPGFELTAANAAAVAQICWRLDGIALAIELAAARAKVLSIQDIADRLDDRFHLLTGGSRTAVPRQKTLRALIDWSYDLLSEPERTLLRRLSVFARGRTLEAIEAVCTDDSLEKWEILDVLTQLVEKSLLTREKTADDGARYFMIESVWDYSEMKLSEAGETDTFRKRHLDYFLRYAESAEARILSHEQQRWMEQLEEEKINFRFAVQTSLEVAGEASKGLRLLSAIQRFIEVRGLFKESRETLERLLNHPDTAARNAARAKALSAAGRLAWIADDLETCARCIPLALEIYRKIGDTIGTAFTLIDLAIFNAFDGDRSGGGPMLEEASGLAETLRDKRLNARLLQVRATLTAQSDYAASFDLGKQSLALYREIGDGWQSGIVLWGVGVTATALGRFDEARADFTECLNNAWDLGNRWGVPYPLEAFAALAVAEGQYTRAASLLGAAEALRAKLGISPEPADHPAVREILASAAEHFISDDVEEARRAGRELSIEQAVALALESEAQK